MSAIVLPTVTIKNRELVKWVALVTMIADHLDYFVLGGSWYLGHFLGGMTLPLFAIALGGSLDWRPSPAWGRVVSRCIQWGIVSHLFVLMVRDFMPLNILFTIAGGVALVMAIESMLSPLRALAIGGAVLLFGPFVEGGFIGVGVVAATLLYVRRRSASTCLLMIGCHGMLVLLNGAGVLFVWPLYLALTLVPWEPRQIPYFFYWAYALQWPLLFVAALALNSMA